MMTCRFRSVPLAWLLLLVAMLSGCGTRPPAALTAHAPATNAARADNGPYFEIDDRLAAEEIVLYALGLLGTGYRFGGRNPEAGMDCSGMVSYIVEQVSGHRLPHNAARIAQITRPIGMSELQPGDLVFFNTLDRRHSHMGIYLGGRRFVHAPSSRGVIRIENLDNNYFGPRIDGARRLIASN
ncbi:MAG TPA: C40 family peptidase [Rhodocyclaceae bacterium]|nr:C40 family peptidase [Rhodocyclaceae bacterium]